MRDQTKVVHAGRHPEKFEGAVNPPVYHVSTVLSPNLADWEQKNKDYAAGRPGMYYGRHGTPTLDALEEAIAELLAWRLEPVAGLGWWRRLFRHWGRLRERIAPHRFS